MSHIDPELRVRDEGTYNHKPLRKTYLEKKKKTKKKTKKKKKLKKTNYMTS